MSNEKRRIEKNTAFFYDNDIVKTVSVNAPAKINLHLEIGSKRHDGYHLVRSLFQAVSFHDQLTVSTGSFSDNFHLSGNFAFPVYQNLIYKAVNVFREHTGVSSDLKITCKKVIPAGGGLGGGSSDAASTLIGLNRLFNTRLTVTELMKLGETIGSDVPFFFGSPTAYVTGRGEKVIPVKTKWELPLLIIETGLVVSTADAYKEIDQNPDRKRDRIDITAMYERYPREWRFFNDFHSILMKGNNIYSQVLQALRDAGSLFHMVSGSGSSVFGIFEDEKSAAEGEKVLKKSFKRVHKGKMLANPTQAVYNSENS